MDWPAVFLPGLSPEPGGGEERGPAAFGKEDCRAGGRDRAAVFPI